MNIVLYKTVDGENVINKTLTDSKTISINFKRDTDFISPDIILRKIQDVNFNEYNYAYISEINRYYFIRGIEAINSEVFRLPLECDYLETYKADILASNARFKRAIKTGDYLDVALEHSILKSVSVHNSNKGFTGSPTMILTTIGA